MSGARLAVGIPTLREADAIENVVRQVDAGLAGLRVDADRVIVNLDSDSPDGTAQKFRDTPTRCRKESLVLGERPPGKGRNVLRFLRYCAENRISALAIVDGDLLSITPDWIEALLTPVLRGEADYVTPLYLRHRFDGPLTNAFAYPLMYGYFGARIRQPVGGEFAFSPALVDFVLRQPAEEATLGYGIDIFLSMHAVGGGFQVAQAALGRKLHKSGFPRRRLIHTQAITAAVATARRHPLRATPRELGGAADFGDCVYDVPEYLLHEPTQAFLAEARAEARERMPVYRSWLDGERTEIAAALEDGGPALSAEAWTDLLAAGIARAVWIEPQTPARVFADHLFPLLSVRTVTCWNETWKRPIEQVNAEIELQAGLLREKLLARAVAQGTKPISA